MTKLVTITAPNGARVTVAAENAHRFEGLFRDLSAAGYTIDGKQTGGYNYRNIAGTNKLSNHAFGNAVDVNWSQNARGTNGNIDPTLARDLASKHGLKWGGDWSNPDPMHFEVAGSHSHHGHVHNTPPAPPPPQASSVPAILQGGYGRESTPQTGNAFVSAPTPPTPPAIEPSQGIDAGPQNAFAQPAPYQIQPLQIASGQDALNGFRVRRYRDAFGTG